MKTLLLIFLLYSCSQLPKKQVHQPTKEETVISIEAAYNHIKMSYLKGCVDAFKHLRVPTAFEHCRDKATEHQKEVRDTID